MRHRTILFTLALCALLLAPAALAQDAEFGEEIKVNEVLLDVIVTDKNGTVIVGLQPEDFVVREGREPVQVSDVTFYSSSVAESPIATLAGEGARVDPVPEDRYFVLFFDDQRKNQSDVRVNLVQRQMRAGRDAAEWARESLAPADWVAVVGYQRSLRVYTDFTRDPQRIASAISAAASGEEGMGNWPSRQKEDGAGPSLTDDLPQGKELVKKSTRVYSALSLVADATADVVGRKNLVYFGIGFGRLNSFGQYERDPRYYPGMVKALNDANVAVYPLDVTPQGVEHSFEGALTDVSEETGGRYFPFFSSFTTPLNEIAQETGGYYLLSYRSERPADESGYQEVSVATVNPEFRVRARQGYLY